MGKKRKVSPARAKSSRSREIKPREQGVALPPRSPQQIEELIDHVLRAIAQHETGGKAIESRMRTSAGVRASYASQVQATVGWAITVLLSLDDASLEKEFQITRSELLRAQEQANVTGRLWDAVHRATPETTVQAFLAGANHQRLFTQSGFTPAELARMWSFHILRGELTDAYKQEIVTRKGQLQALPNQQLWQRSRSSERGGVMSADSLTPDARLTLIERVASREAREHLREQFAAGSIAPTLGIDAVSLDAYVRKNWAEDQVAWMRFAVERIPLSPNVQQTIGVRIKGAATAGEGLTLGAHRIGRLVRQSLQSTPNVSDEEVCRNIAKKHNPGAGDSYVEAVLQQFRKLL